MWRRVSDEHRVMSDDSVEFYPANAAVPDGLRTDDLLLLSLRPEHVALDFDALMASRIRLRVEGDDDWPRDDFTLAENLADLEGRWREHQARIAFTYTVLNPAATRCEGCVYINPWQRILRHTTPDSVRSITPQPNESVVHYWVRDSALARELDRALVQSLVEWFDQDWAFAQVYFWLNDVQERDAQVLTDAGLRVRYTLTGRETRRRWSFYSTP
jgi:hypothetical protein